MSKLWMPAGVPSNVPNRASESVAAKYPRASPPGKSPDVNSSVVEMKNASRATASPLREDKRDVRVHLLAAPHCVSVHRWPQAKAHPLLRARTQARPVQWCS